MEGFYDQGQCFSEDIHPRYSGTPASTALSTGAIG